MQIAWRLFSKHRGLTALAVSTLAIALGLATALASVADAILLRPLPVNRPQEIVRIFTSSTSQPLGLVSYPDFEDFRRESRTVAGVVAQSQVLLAAGDAPAEVRMALAVTPDYFDVLGVSPAPGRGFRAEESREAVIVLSRAYWKSHFAADPRAIGRSLRLCGTPFTIVGIAPENFGLDRFSHEDLYFPMGVYAAGLLPISGQPLNDRARRYLNVYARLAHGATLEQARGELAMIGARLAGQNPDADRGRRAVAITEFQARTQTDRTMPALAALLAVAAFLILAIACANVATVLLVRSEARGQEIAVRVALGATPLRLLGENLIESGALSLAGAALGFPLAYAATQLLTRAATLPTDFRFAIAPAMDSRIGLVLLATATIVAIICGTAPALRRVDIAARLKSRTAPSSAKSRSLLVAFAVALATALIACAGFLLDGIAAAQRTHPGYRTDGVLTIALDPAQVRYNEAQARAFFDQVLARVRQIAGVKGAVLAQSVPLGYTGAQRQIAVRGESMTMWMNIVGPGYFERMRMPLVAGRGFDEGDLATSAPVAVVNQELAKQCGLGCAFRMNSREVRVIGVARTAKYFQIGEAPRPYFYLPFSQNYASRMVLHVETSGDPGALAHRVADELHRIDRAQPLSEIRPLSAYLTEGSMFQARIGLRVLDAVGLGSVGLALAGIYGVIAHALTRRRREIGIRIALGARRRTVILALAADVLIVMLSGIVAGLGAAVAASPLLSGVSGKGAFNGTILGITAALVILASAPAVLAPAWKASDMDPAAALRAE